MMLLKQLIELFLGLPDYSEALCIVAQMKDLKHRFKSKKTESGVCTKRYPDY